MSGAPDTSTTTETAWHAGIEGEDLGHLQNRGWNKPAGEVVGDIYKAFRSAESRLGVPADRLVTLPKDTADDAGWKSVWQKLGAPEKADDYKFEGIEFEGADTFKTAMREAAAKANMPTQMADAAARAAAEFIANAAKAGASDKAEAQKVSEAALKDNWGNNANAFQMIADRGAAAVAAKMGAVGNDLPKLAAAAKEAGLTHVFAEMMRVVGVGYGEDKLVLSPSGSGDGMTVDQAKARKEEMFRDQEWVSRYSKGGAAERRELLAINQLIVAQQQA